MRGDTFYDTSVLAYAFDASEHEKADIALGLIKKVARGAETGIISNQVLAELFFVVKYPPINGVGFLYS